jgi:putative ABC transport system permease protein
MTDLAYLAWRYLVFNRWKVLILVTSITLIVYLPVGLNVLAEQSAQRMTARAAATPLLTGAKGSPLELTLNSLYFDLETPALSRFGQVTRIREGGLATPVPLYVRFNVRGHPIVGTSLEYFSFRETEIGQGRQMTVLGEVVLGARVARELDVGPGDAVISSPENVFDLAGVYPLKLKVVGVLQPTFTPDDDAIFTDIKTTWIMEGLGHGHQDLQQTETAILNRDDTKIVANASVVQYNEITPDNINSFHFHGDNTDFPVSAILAIPVDRKSGVILQGRYAKPDEVNQIVRPLDVITKLLGTILTIQQFVTAAIVMIGLATFATATLVFMLSIRLRQRERLTLFKIGGARSTITGLLLTEIIAVISASLLLATLLTLISRRFGEDLIRVFLLT